MIEKSRGLELTLMEAGQVNDYAVIDFDQFVCMKSRICMNP